MRYAEREGVSDSMFPTYGDEWKWLRAQKHVPSRDVFAAQFPDFRWRRVDKDDIPSIAVSLKDAYVRMKTAQAIEEAAKNIKKLSPADLAMRLRDQVNTVLDATEVSGVTEIIMEGSKFYKDFRRRQRLKEQGKLVGIPTGIPRVDEYTGGLLDSRLYLMIARQGNFKTYLMLWLAARAIIEGKRVLWVSREMPEDMVAYRLHTIMASQLRGPDNTFSNLGLILGREDVDADDYRKFLKKLRTDIKGRFFMPESRRVSIMQLGPYMERHAPEASFYDYIGVGSGMDAASRGWQELGAQAQHAKDLAMEYKHPVVMASQVNRAAADGEAPMVENISFADGIGYAADQVIGLQAGDLYEDDNGHLLRTLEIWLRKQRYGAADVNVTCSFDGDRGYLSQIDGPMDGFEEEGNTKVRSSSKPKRSSKEEEDKPSRKRSNSGAKSERPKRAV